MKINSFLEKRWPAYLMFLLALLVILAAYGVRRESMLHVAAAFGSILWLTQIPGSMILLLSDRLSAGRLRLLVMGQGLGMAILPLLYTLLLALGAERQYVLVQSVINVALIALVVLRRREEIGRGLAAPIATQTLLPISFLFLAVAVAVALRELLFFHPDNLVIYSSQEVDTGYLMGMVIGLREHGQLVDMNGGGVPTHYHYFLYLFQAVVSGMSGATALTVVRAVFPVFLFSFLTLAAFSTTRFISGSWKAGLLGGVLLLFLNDLSVLNNIIATLLRTDALNWVYGTLNVGFLHASPSWLGSIVLLMILIGELVWLQRQNAGLSRFIPFLLIISVLVGYKVPTWMCLVAGMGLASLLMVKRRPVYLIVSILAGIGGLVVLFTCVGVSSAQSALGEISIAYPVLRNDSVTELAGLDSPNVTLSELTPGLVLLILLLIPFWIALTYGVRVLWLADATRRFKQMWREDNYAEMAVLLAVAVGLIISILAAPANMPIIVYYNSLFGLLASIPFVAALLYRKWPDLKPLTRYAIVALILLQMASGLLYVVKPIVARKKVVDMGGEWLQAMNWLRTSTPPDAIVQSNRFDFSPDSTIITYHDAFYYVPAFSERIVAVSGRRFYLAPDSVYRQRRALVDTIYASTSPERVKGAIDSLDIDYVVFDRWRGGSMAITDTTHLGLVYQNGLMEIYEVR